MFPFQLIYLVQRTVKPNMLNTSIIKVTLMDSQILEIIYFGVFQKIRMQMKRCFWSK